MLPFVFKKEELYRYMSMYIEIYIYIFTHTYTVPHQSTICKSLKNTEETGNGGCLLKGELGGRKKEVGGDFSPYIWHCLHFYHLGVLQLLKSCE